MGKTDVHGSFTPLIFSADPITLAPADSPESPRGYIRRSRDLSPVNPKSQIGLETMNWVQRKIYLYNVTFGLYMLDWWERCLFNMLMLVLLWFVCYTGTHHATEFYRRHLQ